MEPSLPKLLPLSFSQISHVRSSPQSLHPPTSKPIMKHSDYVQEGGSIQ